MPVDYIARQIHPSVAKLSLNMYDCVQFVWLHDPGYRVASLMLVDLIIMEVDPSIAKLPLKFNGSLAKLVLPSTTHCGIMMASWNLINIGLDVAWWHQAIT